MEIKDGIKTFYAKSRSDWRNWLEDNHDKEQSVWLIMYKKDTKIPSIYYPEAVEEALCFGWIDSKPNKRDDQSFYQFFSRRNPKSKWSKINKDNVAKLQEQGLMHASGMKMVQLAKETGTWDALNDVENRIIPTDLQAKFDENPMAFKYWDAFSPSTQKGILQWIASAKQPETRAKRIEETVFLAAKNEKANQYIPKK